jgi:hypothetical protein
MFFSIAAPVSFRFNLIVFAMDQLQNVLRRVLTTNTRYPGSPVTECEVSLATVTQCVLATYKRVCTIRPLLPDWRGLTLSQVLHRHRLTCELYPV